MNKRLDMLTGSPALIFDPVPAKWISELFARFAATYGRLWSSSHDSENDLKLSVIAWSEDLAGLSRDDIRCGIANLAHKDDPKYPPNAYEFRELCVGNQASKWALQSYRPFKRVENGVRTKSVARKAMSDIKFQLGLS